jgi:acetyl-CoA carboxylase carboxyl transferase subunit alpha
MDNKKIIKSNLKNKIHLGAWEKLNIARLIERPTSLDFIEEIFDDFIELHGDRHFADDKCIIGGIATLNSMAVTIVGQQRGRNTKENIERNFGMPQPEGYRKALRLMKQAEKFNRPIICFVDTKGAYCGIGAEERGQGEAIAKNLLEMSMLKTPIISIVIGEGGSGGALALAVADEVWMLENSIYSTLSPEGFASILWKDSSRAKEAAEAMKVTAENLKEFGIIDKILKEPRGGAHKAPKVMAAAIKDELIKSLAQLTQKPLDVLVQDRYNKFRNMGRFMEQ